MQELDTMTDLLIMGIIHPSPPPLRRYRFICIDCWLEFGREEFIRTGERWFCGMVPGVAPWIYYSRNISTNNPAQ